MLDFIDFQQSQVEGSYGYKLFDELIGSQTSIHVCAVHISYRLSRCDKLLYMWPAILKPGLRRKKIFRRFWHEWIERFRFLYMTSYFGLPCMEYDRHKHARFVMTVSKLKLNFHCYLNSVLLTVST